MQQNATAAGALPRTPLGSLQCSPRPLGGFKGDGLWRGDDDDIYLAKKPGYQKGHKPINAGCPYKKYYM